MRPPVQPQAGFPGRQQSWHRATAQEASAWANTQVLPSRNLYSHFCIRSLHFHYTEVELVLPARGPAASLDLGAWHASAAQHPGVLPGKRGSHLRGLLQCGFSEGPQNPGENTSLRTVSTDTTALALHVLLSEKCRAIRPAACTALRALHRRGGWGRQLTLGTNQPGEADSPSSALCCPITGWEWPRHQTPAHT